MIRSTPAPVAMTNGPVVPMRRDASATAQRGWEIKAKSATEGEVWIYGTIGDSFWEEGITAKDFAQELAAMGRVQVINVYINSPGGSVFQGEAIYNSLRRHSARKVVHIDGLAASIASIIAMAGDEIVIANNGLMMIHDPEGVAMGRADDFRKMASTLDKVKDTLVDTYVLRTGGDREKISAMMVEETWFTAAEAIAAGFADREAEPVKVAAFAGLDLKAFKHPPVELKAAVEAAPEPDDQPEQPGRPEGAPRAHPAVTRVEARLRRRGLLSA